MYYAIPCVLYYVEQIKTSRVKSSITISCAERLEEHEGAKRKKRVHKIVYVKKWRKLNYKRKQ